MLQWHANLNILCIDIFMKTKDCVCVGFALHAGIFYIQVNAVQ